MFAVIINKVLTNAGHKAPGRLRLQIFETGVFFISNKPFALILSRYSSNIISKTFQLYRTRYNNEPD